MKHNRPFIPSPKRKKTKSKSEKKSKLKSAKKARVRSKGTDEEEKQGPVGEENVLEGLWGGADVIGKGKGKGEGVRETFGMEVTNEGITLSKRRLEHVEISDEGDGKSPAKKQRRSRRKQADSEVVMK